MGNKERKALIKSFLDDLKTIKYIVLFYQLGFYGLLIFVICDKCF